MIVQTILFILQTLLFLLFFALGSVLLPLFPSLPVWQLRTSAGHAFVFDGVLFAAVVYLALLLLETARKRLRSAGLGTTAAFLVALGLGLLMRFGFKSL